MTCRPPWKVRADSRAPRLSPPSLTRTPAELRTEVAGSRTLIERAVARVRELKRAADEAAEAAAAADVRASRATAALEGAQRSNGDLVRALRALQASSRGDLERAAAALETGLSRDARGSLRLSNGAWDVGARVNGLTSWGERLNCLCSDRLLCVLGTSDPPRRLRASPVSTLACRKARAATRVLPRRPP